MAIYSKSYAKELWEVNKKDWLRYHGNYAKQCQQGAKPFGEEEKEAEVKIE